MIEIKLEEASSLTLEMHIDGDVKKDAPQLRFSVLVEGMRYSFGSKQTSSGVYEIEFPKMLGKITEGEYMAEVEIILDGKHFVPLEETVKFTKEVKPVVKLAEAISQVEKETAVKVKMGKVRVEAPKKIISDVRGLMASLNESEEFDTDFALAALGKFALKETAVMDNIKIAPKRALVENEAIAALRLIRQANSTDVSSEAAAWEGIRGISEKVDAELSAVLAEKGISMRKLKKLGF